MKRLFFAALAYTTLSGAMSAHPSSYDLSSPSSYTTTEAVAWANKIGVPPKAGQAPLCDFNAKAALSAIRHRHPNPAILSPFYSTLSWTCRFAVEMGSFGGRGGPGKTHSSGAAVASRSGR